MLRDTSAAIVHETEEVVRTETPLGYRKPNWWDNKLNIEGRFGRLQSIVRDYVTGNLKGRVKAMTGNGNHIYYTKNNGNDLWIYKNNPSVRLNICIAKKVNGYFVGNASSITAIRQKPSKKDPKGKLNWTNSRSCIQQVLNEVMTMVPFRTFQEAQLNLESFSVVDKGQEESVLIGRGVHKSEQHYMGAMLFKVSFNDRSKELRGHEDRYFLFDIDRNDLKLNNLNPFLSELKRPCTTIADAYDSLKPQEVREAELFLKQECVRQGEWFFIPVQGRFKRKTSNNRSWVTGRVRQGRKPFEEAILQSKGNRPHYVKFISEEGYVTGKVTHGGREHEPIDLIGWHKAVPNNAVESFTITGGID